jgi:hypothetical protein
MTRTLQRGVETSVSARPSALRMSRSSPIGSWSLFVRPDVEGAGQDHVRAGIRTDGPAMMLLSRRAGLPGLESLCQDGFEPGNELRPGASPRCSCPAYSTRLPRSFLMRSSRGIPTPGSRVPQTRPAGHVMGDLVVQRSSGASLDCSRSASACGCGQDRQRHGPRGRSPRQGSGVAAALSGLGR